LRSRCFFDFLFLFSALGEAYLFKVFAPASILTMSLIWKVTGMAMSPYSADGSDARLLNLLGEPPSRFELACSAGIFLLGLIDLPEAFALVSCFFFFIKLSSGASPPD